MDPLKRLRLFFRNSRERRLLQHSVEVEFPSERFGEKVGYQVVTADLSRESVIYSMGVGKNVEFDLALIRRFGARVLAFDPTPRSQEWVRTQQLPPEFEFYPLGVADFDGVAHFHPPIRDGAPDYTFVEREERGTGAAVEGQVRRLGTLMEQFGHPTIHLLKLDIEGAEYPVLADLVRSKLDVRQIVVEFHHRWPEFGETKTREAVNLLHTAGFRIFALVKNRDYSLIRTDRP